jgi:hypothetical protein
LLDYFKDDKNYKLFGSYLDSSNLSLQKYGYMKIFVDEKFGNIQFSRMDYGVTSFLTLSYDNTQLLEPMLIRDSTNKRYAYLNVYDTSFVIQKQLLVRDTVIVGGVHQIQKSKNHYFYYLTLKKDGTCNICSYVYLYKLDENYNTIGKFKFGNSQNETMTLQLVTNDEKFLLKRVDQTKSYILYRPINYFLYNNTGELIYSIDTLCKQEEPMTIESEYLLESNDLILIEKDNKELTYNLRYYNNQGEFVKRILLHDQKIDTTMLLDFQFTRLEKQNVYLLSCTQRDGSGDTNKIIDTGIRLFILDLTVGVQPNLTEVSANSLFPNPASEFINVKEFILSRYKIFSLTGAENIQGIINDEKLNVSALKSGVYFIAFNFGGKTTTYKFIKQ